jgi:hypothetical protein
MWGGVTIMLGRLALAGSVAAIIMCGAAAPAPKHVGAAGHAAKPVEQATAATPKPAKPYVYPYACDRPLSAQQDNLCLQRRAIETADKWGRLTFRVGLAIAVGLFLTLLVTAAATWSATKSAVAAVRSARIAEKALARATLAAESTQGEPRPSSGRPRQRQQSST